MNGFFLFLTIVCYITGWIGLGFFFRTFKNEAVNLSHKVLFIGLIFHTCLLLNTLKIILTKKIFTFSFLLYFFSWELLLIYFYFYIKKLKVYLVGFFVLPIILIFLGFSLTSIGEKVSPFNKNLYSLWFPIHGFTSLISHGFLIFGMIVSLLYLLQERELKKKKLGFLFNRLPSLNILDHMIEKCLYYAFLFLTIGIITGVLWSEQVYGIYWRWSAKELATLFLWALYAVLIHQRILIGWRGKKTAYAFLIGFIIWFGSFFLLNFLTKGFHTYG